MKTLIAAVALSLIATAPAMAAKYNCLLSTTDIKGVEDFHKHPVTLVDKGNQWDAYFDDGSKFVTSPILKKDKEDSVILYGMKNNRQYSKGIAQFTGMYDIRFIEQPDAYLMIDCRNSKS